MTVHPSPNALRSFIYVARLIRLVERLTGRSVSPIGTAERIATYRLEQLRHAPGDQ